MIEHVDRGSASVSVHTPDSRGFFESSVPLWRMERRVQDTPNTILHSENLKTMHRSGFPL